MKRFSKSLREHPKNKIDFEKKKMLPLTEEELKSHQDAKVCCICGKSILKKFSKSINYQEVRDDCYYAGKYGAASHSICNLKLHVSNKIPVVFHDGSIYDYHFIIKKLAKKFEEKFGCLGENTEKYKTFSILVEKEVMEIDRDDNESVVTISHKIKFINSARFIATLLSSLIDNLTEAIHKIKFKDCDCFPEYESVKESSIKI